MRYFYYKGWSLVDTERGCFVNSRMDVYCPPLRVFHCIECAKWVVDRYGTG